MEVPGEEQLADVQIEMESVVEQREDTTTTVAQSGRRERGRYLSDLVPHVFAVEILTYLTMQEMSAFSTCSKFCLEMTKDSYLWSSLVVRDFDHTGGLNGPLMLRQGNLADKRDEYIARFRAMNAKLGLACAERLQAVKARRRQKRIEALESCIDLMQIRVMTPLPFFCLIASLSMWALFIDGWDVSFWVCATPLFVMVVYLTVCAAVVNSAHRHRHDPRSAFFGLWGYMRGPIHALWTLVREKPSLVYSSLTAFLFLLLQVLLVSLKMSDETDSKVIPVWVSRSLPWAVTFLPLWLLALLYVLLPSLGACRGRAQRNKHCVGLVFMWLPFVILACLATMRLTYEDRRRNHGERDTEVSADKDSSALRPSGLNVPLAHILMPMWVIEGLSLLASAGSLLSALVSRNCNRPMRQAFWAGGWAEAMWRCLPGCQRARVPTSGDHGFFDDGGGLEGGAWGLAVDPLELPAAQVPASDEALDGAVKTFVVTWLFLVPLVVFQALLSAKDERDSDKSLPDISLKHAIIPIIATLGWYALFVVFLTFRVRTPLQSRRQALRALQADGQLDLFLI